MEAHIRLRHPELADRWSDHVYFWGRRHFDGTGKGTDVPANTQRAAGEDDMVGEGEEDEEEDEEGEEEDEEEEVEGGDKGDMESKNDSGGRGSNQDGPPSGQDRGDSQLETRINDLLTETDRSALFHPYARVPATYRLHLSAQRAPPTHPLGHRPSSPRSEPFRRSMISYGALTDRVLNGDYGERRQSEATTALSPLLKDQAIRRRQLLDRSTYEMTLQVLCEEEAEKVGMSPEEWKAEEARGR